MNGATEHSGIHAASTAAGGFSLQRMLAAMLLVILSPLLALSAVSVAVFLGRPIVFRQTRTGLHGRPFTLIKFRSLKDLRDENGVPLPDAVRSTIFSRLLRRSRIDELLQLVCIARGDMAFIGPRPLLPDTIRSLGESGSIRCTVRPGLMGWAQVCGNTRLGDRTKVALDIWYIRHRSAVLDLRIVYETLVTVLLGEKRAPDRIQKAETYLRQLDIIDPMERNQ